MNNHTPLNYSITYKASTHYHNEDHSHPLGFDIWWHRDDACEHHQSPSERA